ncbi:MAG: hypothetical protein ACI9N3_000488, partial [Colwellia sp.]
FTCVTRSTNTNIKHRMHIETTFYIFVNRIKQYNNFYKERGLPQSGFSSAQIVAKLSVISDTVFI